MIRSLQNSASGINAQQARIDITANNIASENVDGYKAQRASFADMVYSLLSDAGRPVEAPSGEKPLHGSGTRQVANNRDFNQGFIRQTGRNTDLAINGNGFFKIDMPDGSFAYTRNGNFNLNADRELVTSDGYQIDSHIALPEGSHDMAVSSDGQVTAVDADGNTVDVGKIQLYNFVNSNGLKSLGKGMYAVTGEEGQEEEGTPGSEGFGKIVQGSLESSNVDLALEMTNLLESQRLYQLNARALSTSDEMWGMANNLRK